MFGLTGQRNALISEVKRNFANVNITSVYRVSNGIDVTLIRLIDFLLCTLFRIDSEVVLLLLDTFVRSTRNEERS